MSRPNSVCGNHRENIPLATLSRVSSMDTLAPPNPSLPRSDTYTSRFSVARAAAPKVTRLARRIHGWSWQAVSTVLQVFPRARTQLAVYQFPIGMGTGAVYVTMSGIKEHTPVLTHVETVFFFMNIALFLLNTSTLLLQAIREFNHHSSF